jgi:hypothetical protein
MEQAATRLPPDIARSERDRESRQSIGDIARVTDAVQLVQAHVAMHATCLVAESPRNYLRRELVF